MLAIQLGIVIMPVPTALVGIMPVVWSSLTCYSGSVASAVFAGLRSRVQRGLLGLAVAPVALGPPHPPRAVPGGAPRGAQGPGVALAGDQLVHGRMPLFFFWQNVLVLVDQQLFHINKMIFC